MNFLAHAFLSFGHPQLIVGNMISDFVKGRSKYSYSEGIQRGIALHRAIDHFTDAHFITHRANEIFRPSYRLYSGAIMDVLYDHFLANDERYFTETVLKDFAQHIYTRIEEHSSELPPTFIGVFAYMRTDDWLFNYRRKEGIQKSLKGLIRRAAYLSESDTAYGLFLQHYDELNECYRLFIDDVKNFAKEQYEQFPLAFRTFQSNL
jgi:acyl carrier protein phosphodiesterase